VTAVGDGSPPADGVVRLPAAHAWSLYGVRLTSDHAFVNAVPVADGGVADASDELSFAYVGDAPLPAGWDRAPAAYASPILVDDEQSFLYVIPVGACTVFRFTEVADFFIWPDRILCRLLDPAYGYMVELHLLGFVMAYWLERRGLIALHASAVVVDGHAVGFLSTNTGGKSSIAASFLQAGHPLLTDDILAIERAGETVIARPSYPQMRMWPELARHFLGSDDHLQRVHPRLRKRRVPVGQGGFGTFSGSARPLACLYVPERREGGEVSIGELPFGAAVFSLERYAFLLGILQDTGMQQARLPALSRIAAAVPVRRVAYPSGLERLPDVVAAIAADARAVLARAEPAR